MSNIVVVAEVRAGKLKRPSLEAVAAGQQLAASTGGKVIAIALGSGLDAAGQELANSGAHQVVLVDSPSLANFSGDAYARIVTERCKANGATAVLMAHTAMGKDLLPRVAALLDASVITDAVGVAFEGGAFTAKKPVFAGKATMTARATKTPFCASVRPGTFAPACSPGDAEVSKAAAPAGDLLAVLTLFAWTGYFIVSRRVRGRLGAVEYSTVTAIVASGLAWPAALIARQDVSWPAWDSWGWIVMLAVVAGIGGHFLMSWSIPHVPLWASSTMSLSIPVISTVTAAVVLDESVTAVQALGMLIVLVALACAVRVSSPKPSM